MLSRHNAEDLWLACKRNIWFWINAFVFTYDPRAFDTSFEDDELPIQHAGDYQKYIEEGIPCDSTEIPFITYPFQDGAIQVLIRALGRRDVVIEKSRDMGASWLCLMVFLWRWLFYRRETFLLISRTEAMVDKSDDPDSLMWKLDFVLENMPPFLVPQTWRDHRKNLHFYNPNTKCTMDGSSTTGNVGRGGRRTASLLDELGAFKAEDGYRAWAATQSTTRCRLVNSTPQGNANVYADIVRKIKGQDAEGEYGRDILQGRGMDLLTLHWTMHPQKRRSMYVFVNNRIEMLDEAHPLPSDYPFKKDGKVRSPFYDLEDLRSPHPYILAQEQDLDPLGSDIQFFSEEIVRDQENKNGMRPLFIGDIDFDGSTLRPTGFAALDRGPLRMWIDVESIKTPPRDRRYKMGIDIATGTEASNSVISVADAKTRAKVAQYTTSGMNPSELADVAVALAYFFIGLGDTPALMAWEANGPGREFGNRIIRVNYPFFYRRRLNEESLTQRWSSVPGWWSTPRTKRTLFGAYRQALKNHTYLNRCLMALNECRQIVFLPNGDITHSRAAASIDASGARDNHADHCVADALVNMLLDMDVHDEKTEATAPEGSLAWRLALEEKEQKISATGRYDWRK